MTPERLPFTGRSWSIEVPAHVKLLTSNSRLTRAEEMTKKRQLRELGFWLGMSRRIPKIQFAYIVAYLLVSDNRERDPLNWAPTAKALVDGLAGNPHTGPSAQILPTDSVKHLLGPDLRLLPSSPRTGFLVRIRELEYMPPPAERPDQALP